MKQIKHWSVWDWTIAGIAFGVTLIAIGEAFAQNKLEDYSKKYECTPLQSIDWEGASKFVVLDSEGTEYLQRFISTKYGEPPFDISNTFLSVTVLQSGRGFSVPVYFYVDKDNGCTYRRSVNVEPEISEFAESLFEDYTLLEKNLGGEDI